MRSSRLVLTLAALAAACSSEDPRSHHITAYDTLDSCTAFSDEATCLENADRCVWYALGMPCVEGEPCVSGVCQDIDPCRVHTDAESCAGDTGNRCAWADVELCPGEDCGEGGFCYQVTDDEDCTCVCPLEPCAEGEECPPCECDCPDDGGGGGTCTCTGTVCPEGDPDCVPTMDCTCEDDPCLGYGDEETCAADPACAWLQDPCPLCPDCAPGTDCEPCTCDESFSCRHVGDSGCGGSGGGGSDGGSTEG